MMHSTMIARARELRMDAEKGNAVERMKLLGELANALDAADNVIAEAKRILAPYYRSAECRADVEAAYRILNHDDPAPFRLFAAQVDGSAQ